MAKYFIHNDEQELTMNSPYHNLLGRVPSGWTVVDYQNAGEQADVSDAALAIESEAGLTIIDSMTNWVARDDAAHDALVAMGKPS